VPIDTASTTATAMPITSNTGSARCFMTVPLTRSSHGVHGRAKPNASRLAPDTRRSHTERTSPNRMKQPSRRLASLVVLSVAIGMVATSADAQTGFKADATRQLETYGEIVYRTYRDAHRAALELQKAVEQLIATPTPATLARARKAWLATRPSYGRSEAFRFYGGPIDAGKQDDFGSATGLEGLLNAWPLNEAFIDYVIQGSEPIAAQTLVRKNARDDEADVTTGFHAVEFLLWGQDRNPNGPGDRQVSDFVGEGSAKRRRTYLKAATDLIVEQLKTLVDAWAPKQQNYRAMLLKMQQATSVQNMLTGIATLCGFELASERLGTALDSSSQEDEQSCFSDSTHVDVLANAIGIENVYLGRYDGFRGAGLDQLVAAANPDLARYLAKQLHTTVELARQLDQPFDRTLASPEGSPQRARVEALVSSLQILADLLKQSAAALGVPILLGDND
jgi:putative iron-regulated protein